MHYPESRINSSSSYQWSYLSPINSLIMEEKWDKLLDFAIWSSYKRGGRVCWGDTEYILKCIRYIYRVLLHQLYILYINDSLNYESIYMKKHINFLFSYLSIWKLIPHIVVEENTMESYQFICI